MSKLPEGWIETSIGQLTQVVGGGTPSTSVQSHFEGNIPWITPADLSGYDEVYIAKGRRNLSKEGLSDSSAKLLPKDSVLYSTRAPIGYVAIAANPLATNQGFKSMLPSDLYISKFAYYYLKSIKAYAESEASGTTFKELSGKKFGDLKFPLPPLPEQKRIVAKLDNLFAHLDQLKARLQNIPTLLKQFRQSVLTQAVTGKLTEEWRGRNEPDLENELQLFKDLRVKEFGEYEQSLFLNNRRSPKLPNVEGNILDWAIHLTIESASLVIVDCLHDTPKFSGEGKYCIDTTCIQPFKINWDDARFVSEDVFKEWIVRHRPSDGDVLFSREGTIGTAVRVPGNIDLCIGQRMMLFRFPKRILSEYAELFLNSPVFQSQVRPLITGTTSPHVNIGDLRKLTFTMPAYEEQKEIVRRVESLFALADRIEANYNKLQEKIDHLPQAILSKAFRGELVVNEELVDK